MKTKFIQFLKSEGIYTEFTHDFKKHGFKRQTFEQYMDTTDAVMYIASAFHWGETSRSEVSYEDGKLFYTKLTERWFDFKEHPSKTKKTSDRQKIMTAIQKYFAALNTGETFYGSILAEYCLEKAGCKNKYPSTVFTYMNQMKNKGLLNYECVFKEQSKYRKL